jgi:hypothetical protein
MFESSASLLACARALGAYVCTYTITYSPARCSYEFALVVRTLFVRSSYEFAYAARALFVRCSYAVRTSANSPANYATRPSDDRFPHL